MHHLLILFVVCWLTSTAENYNVVGTLLRTTIDEYTDDDDTSTESCQLPPYPAHGGYVVLNQQHAKPGDLFANVSLIQYTTDESYKVFEIKRLTCTLGEWYQDILEYQSTTLQFFTSWCPFFCSRFSDDKRTENSARNLIRDRKKLNGHESITTEGSPKENDMSSTSCRLPPYPDHGTYVVPDHPNAKPGDVFQEVSLIQYTSDDRNTVVEIEHFKCSAGAWHQKIFREVSEKFQFHTNWCPTLCSSFFNGGRIAKYGWNRNEFFEQTNQTKFPTNSCTQPPYPKFANYSILSSLGPSKPGDAHDVLRLKYTCDPGYNITGNTNVYCLNGTWSGELPKCVKFCRLNRQPGVDYLCEKVKAGDSVGPCNDYQVDGSIIYPQCNRPYYKPRSTLKPMVCINGEWDNVPKCKPVCGLRLQIEGQMETDPRIKAPWNVAVYNTNSEPYKHVCGGSIVAPNLVVSAAECFYQSEGKTKAPSEFAVVAGKLYRSFFNPNEDQEQMSNVTEIKIPPRFFSVLTSYQDDIALVFLSTPFVFNNYVSPVCLNLDPTFDRIQVAEGRLGQVSSWGRSDRRANDILRVVELPIINILRCFESKSSNFHRFITGDKMCAGRMNDEALCMEDSGAGFAVPETDRSDPRKRYYFLRGIVSGYVDSLCDLSYTTLTIVSRHRHFIMDNFDGVTN